MEDIGNIPSSDFLYDGPDTLLYTGPLPFNGSNADLYATEVDALMDRSRQSPPLPRLSRDGNADKIDNGTSDHVGRPPTNKTITTIASSNPEDWIDEDPDAIDEKADSLLTVTATISRDSTAGLKVQQDQNLAAVFERHDPSIRQGPRNDGKRLLQRTTDDESKFHQPWSERNPNTINSYTMSPRLTQEWTGSSQLRGYKTTALHYTSLPRPETQLPKAERYQDQDRNVQTQTSVPSLPKRLLLRAQIPGRVSTPCETQQMDRVKSFDRGRAIPVNDKMAENSSLHSKAQLDQAESLDNPSLDTPLLSKTLGEAPEGTDALNNKRKHNDQVHVYTDEDGERSARRLKTSSRSAHFDTGISRISNRPPVLASPSLSPHQTEAYAGVGCEQNCGTGAQTLEDPLDTDQGIEEIQPQSRQIVFEVNNSRQILNERLVRSLLRTIRAQENDISFLQQELDRGVSDLDEDTEEISTPPFQVIYAVICETSESHTSMYHDSPTSRISDIERRYGHMESRIFASGESPINSSLRTYLANRKSLHFIALWVTECPEIGHKRRAERIDLERQRSQLALESKLYILAVSTPAKELMNELGKYDLPAVGSALPATTRSRLDIPNSVGVIEERGFYFHNLQDPRRYLDVHSKDVQPDHVSALKASLELAGIIWNERCDQVRNLFSEGFVTRASLQQLFHVNMAIISYQGEAKNEPVVGIIDSIDSHAGRVSLQCWTWKFDGTHFRREGYHVLVEIAEDFAVDHPTRLVDLAAYPSDYALPDTVEFLSDRARKCWSLRIQHFVSYTGLDANNDHRYNNDRFIVDVATHRRLHPKPPSSSQQKQRQGRNRLPFEISIDEVMPTGIALLAMPAIIAGYSLKEKRWTMLHVTNIQEVQFNKQAYESLMLEAQTKELVKALVMTQDTAEGPNDVVEGKGNGLILLLHGGPGTGKTLTAESVAEIAERPLYRVTCGDIGTDPSTVEDYLNTVLYLGKIWNCVVLLDEADVFLEERDFFDLARNSLVSVFLRSLECYEGILILTSNRVGTIDEAFKSRIHVAIHYPDLSRITRKKIWQNFLDILEQNDECNANVVDIAAHMDELMDLELNGRQIRDAVSTARRLALYQRQRMGWSHVSQVVKIVDDFSAYLERTRKHKDPQRARDMGLRAPA